MSHDPRASVYRDLHQGQLARQEERNRHSARTILGIVREAVPFDSVLDVGCGLGTWLAVARELGAGEVLGVEGDWLDRTLLQVEPDRVLNLDLEQPFDLGRRFDLTVCLEVAEHLSPDAADRLVGSLTAHGDLVLFSAAIPFQGGHGHVNEQFPVYWAERFARLGFRPVDLVRPRIWDDQSLLWWLRQNTLLFAHDRALTASEALRREQAVVRPLSVVLPEVYLSRIQELRRQAAEHAALVGMLSKGGTFQAEPTPDGRFSLRRVDPA